MNSDSDFKVVPRHVGIIMDGNRRWAKQAGLLPLEGHSAGYKVLRDITKHAFNRGVKYLTLFTFSTENWQRPADEVDYLMKLFVKVLQEYFSELNEKGIKVKFLGQLDKFPKEIQQLAQRAEKNTKNNTHGNLSLAFGYGGQQEIIDAVKTIVDEGIKSDQITAQTMHNHLYGADLPDLDLVIRTSGEQRTSGFMLWQAAYAELYFTSKNWPEFAASDFDEALQDFAARQRRFGK